MYKISTENRLIMIYGEINEEISELGFDLLDLNETDKKFLKKNPKKLLEPIHVVINTNGGLLYSSLHICDILHSMVAEVKTYASGYCQSGGILLLLAGDKKYSFPHASFMIHSPTFYREAVYANVKNTLKHIDVENQEYEDFIEEYSELTKRDIKKIFSCNIDTCFTATKAKEIGLIDDIVDQLIV